LFLPHLYTVDQVAERLNLHAKTVRRYIPVVTGDLIGMINMLTGKA
jgi:hypothetical protein